MEEVDRPGAKELGHAEAFDEAPVGTIRGEGKAGSVQIRTDDFGACD